MAGKFVFAMAVAGAMAALSAAPSAFANEVVLAFGPNPISQCADLAGRAEAGEGATTRSLVVCDDAVARAKDARDELAASYVNRGVIHLARLEYAAALSDSDAALRLKASLPQALVNRGVALSAQGHNKDAIAAFTQALALASSHPERIYFNRALALEDVGDAKGAYLDYRKAAQLDPTWDMPKQQLARFTVAHAPTS